MPSLTLPDEINVYIFLTFPILLITKAFEYRGVLTLPSGIGLSDVSVGP
jgi:hypothetical protein